jgi:F0F1-type ATP synthase epsilon subunit
VPAAHPEFQCVVVSPLGKLLDCKTTSVVFPAHDGEVGILCNHIPMFCKLGVGVMKITGIPPDVDTPPQVTFLLIEGGFALLAANVLTIMAFAATSLDNNAEGIHLLKRPKAGKSAAVAG